MASRKIWVPQPAARLYGAQGAHPETIRDQFVRQYGEASVQKAELGVILDLLMIMGLIKPSEFVDLMGKKLHRIDEQRRAAAGLESDRG